ncbi:tRNA (adenosine(37)-N6)-threonylcarbamoyltransferase complex transferase subunit TsaD [Candidatus Gromoviella agglomerans]|uniref:tRNA (adenosine(37)-N6)-threonylcarbamoyltransferase complex transferase subunit TsaD n=1 Tax=Candidatus Gromoviella agglomerans TaxID=2806609 RepID=UPI003B75C89A
MRTILAIETSCDDSSCAILQDENILSNIVSTQSIHHTYGGVIPHIAADEHAKNLIDTAERAIHEAQISLKDVDYYTATCGPGLIGSLIVGATFTKTLAVMCDKPFIAMNHLRGHALAARILSKNIKYHYEKKRDFEIKPEFPYLLLLLSGGHSQILIVHDPLKYTVLGSTLDDSVGETFDKVAKMLKLPYPGGPHIEEAAKNGNGATFNFPRPMLYTNDCNMSFSGLKTAVRMQIEKIQNISEQEIKDISASFQMAILEVVLAKTRIAIQKFIQLTGKSIETIVISGGVSANQFISSNLNSKILKEYGIRVISPIHHLCTDNAGMIAWAANEMINYGYKTNDLYFEPTPRWELN